MNKKRLIVFGCSYTFGHGLPDCIGEDKSSPGKYPSKYVYPSLIAKKLGRKAINLSRPGSSNREICYNILNFNFEKDDIVILAWTHSERSMLLDENETEKPHIIGPWCPDKKSKLFYKHFYTNPDEIFITEILYSWSNYFLLNKVEKIINIPPFLNYSRNKIELEKYNFLKTDKTILDFQIDFAADNRHPGVESNQNFASYIIQNFI